MSYNKSLPLLDGSKIPAIGYGTWQANPGEVGAAVVEAVQAGYRHLDFARTYDNQKEIGEALKQVIPSVVKREELFITSKLWCISHERERVPEALQETLDQLGLEYLDLWLVHWPVPFRFESLDKLWPIKDGKVDVIPDKVSVVDTWRGMIDCQKSGKTRSIGVSNFTPKHIDALIAATGVTPVTNQIEAHPLLPQDELKKYHDEKKIILTAYSPLGTPLDGKNKLIDHEVVKKVAAEHGKEPAAVLYAWGVQRGYSVLTKSVTPSRIKSNFEQITLTDKQFKEISDLVKSEGVKRTLTPFLVSPQWPIRVFDEPSEKDAPFEVNIKA